MKTINFNRFIFNIADKNARYHSSKSIEWPNNNNLDTFTPIAPRVLVLKILLSKNDNSALDYLPDYLESINADFADFIKQAHFAIDSEIILQVESWSELPILVYDQATNSAQILAFALGLLPASAKQDYFEEALFKEDAKNAIAKAFQLANQLGQEQGLISNLLTEKRHFVLLARNLPEQLQQKIDGESLGLPLFLVANLLLNKQTLPDDFVCTGALANTGTIQSVGYVKEKCAIAKKNAMQVFLYPKANEVALSVLADNILALAVNTSTEALGLIKLHNERDILKNYASWRDDPENLFAWLGQSTFKAELLPTIINLLNNDAWSTKIYQFTTKTETILENLRDKWENKKIKNNTDAILALLELFPYEKIANLGLSLGLYRLCDCWLTALNHQGANSREWQALSDKCLADPQIQQGIEFEPISTTVRKKVSDLHNKYDFSLKSLDELERELQDFELADVFSRCQKKGKINTDLGKYYGFHCQHLAFAGEYAQAREAANKSLAMFSTAEDKKRRYLDLIYIELDSNNLTEAEANLRKALGCENFASENFANRELASDKELVEYIVKSNDSFLQAAFVRFCRQVPTFFQNYPVKLILETKASKNHPWQLWAQNCGYLLAMPEQIWTNRALAKQCFDFSLNICVNDAYFAISAMALLSLAGLSEYRLCPDNEILSKLSHTLTKIKDGCDKDQLNKEHFNLILEALGAKKEHLEILELVKAKIPQLFPFDYR